MNFQQRLKALREKRGLSQRQLAKKAGFSQVIIHYWERGKKSPKGESLVRVASALGTTTDYLLTGKRDAHADILAAADADPRLANLLADVQNGGLDEYDIFALASMADFLAEANSSGRPAHDVPQWAGLPTITRRTRPR